MKGQTGLLRGFPPCSPGGDNKGAYYHGAEKGRVIKGKERVGGGGEGVGGEGGGDLWILPLGILV